MSEFKGTPGPWVNVGGWVDSKGKHSKIICAIGPVSTQAKYIQESNANLIAAAPELLEALQALIKDYDDFREKTGSSHIPQNEMMLTARAAIAQALGGNQS